MVSPLFLPQDYNLGLAAEFPLGLGRLRKTLAWLWEIPWGEE